MMKQGFSLVELSIVLVILGLLVGGVLGGQTLIRAAELRKLTTSFEETHAALNSFRVKYHALPGDMTNATQFWGAANTAGTGGECADSLANAGTGTQTCNGNGNQQINSTERYRVWQHLSNAGLVSANYTGVAGADPGTWGADDDIGVNVPAAAVNNGGYGLGYHNQTELDTYNGYNQKPGNYLLFGSCCHPDGHTVAGRFMRAEEVWNVDSKVDDAQAFSGRLQVRKGYWSGCVTALAATADYDLDNADNNCTFLIGSY